MTRVYTRVGPNTTPMVGPTLTGAMITGMGTSTDKKSPTKPRPLSSG